MNGSLKCIALTGFSSQAFPVYIDLDRLLSKTPDAVPTPSLDTLMSFHNKPIDDLIALNPTNDWNNTQVRRAIVLPPSLYTTVLDEPWDNSMELLHRTIKLIASFKDDNDTIIDLDDDQEPGEWDFALDFTEILLTLYIFTKDDLTNTATTSHSSATDQTALAWTREKHNIIHAQNTTISINNDSNTVVLTLDKVITDRLAEVRNTQFANPNPPSTNNNKENNDTTNKKLDDASKTWLKIDPTFRQGVLFASCADEVSIPSLPNQRLLQVIHTKNGGTTAKLFTRWHPSLDLLVQQGMALNITKCMFTSSPSPSSINTFSVFFTPPPPIQSRI
jgi:hypothetical protein